MSWRRFFSHWNVLEFFSPGLIFPIQHAFSRYSRSHSFVIIYQNIHLSAKRQTNKHTHTSHHKRAIANVFYSANQACMHKQITNNRHFGKCILSAGTQHQRIHSHKPMRGRLKWDREKKKPMNHSNKFVNTVWTYTRKTACCLIPYSISTVADDNFGSVQDEESHRFSPLTLQTQFHDGKKGFKSENTTQRW